MSSRRKKPDRIVDLDRFVADAEQIHKILISYTGRLYVASAHFRAIEAVHAELIKAIKEVTGDNPPWVYRSSVGPYRPD
jgi:uncharacterized caspase-like protein